MSEQKTTADPNTQYVNPRTGEIVDIADMDNEQLADLMLDIHHMQNVLDAQEKSLRRFLEENLEGDEKDFGGRGIEVKFSRYKKYDILDMKKSNEYAELKAEGESKLKEAKKLFDAYKEDIGTSKVQMSIKYPKYFTR